MAEFTYPGGELELFRHARNWKNYWANCLQGHLQGHVVEVGAGIGANTPLLTARHPGPWTCLEPDRELADELGLNLGTHGLSERCEVVVGTLADLPPDRRFDTVLYVDVLEHIEDDRAELERAGRRLKPGGRLIVLGPAHPFLYSNFDRAIGHYRRYTRRSLRATAPPAFHAEHIRYLDAVGLAASLVNRYVLRQSDPALRQILTWDRLMVPVSRLVDGCFGYRLGKSVLGVWTKA
jgi:SAM-dependent methyltransferase